MDGDTLFSQGRFVEAVVKSGAAGPAAVPILFEDKSHGGAMWGVEYPQSFGRRRVELVPWGLYASPAGTNRPADSVPGILQQLKTLRFGDFTWYVRFDHEGLARRLADFQLPFTQTTTQVLRLNGSYERVFAGFNATIRNQVRRAHRGRIQVRRAEDAKSIVDYYQVHKEQAQQKGNYRKLYPIALFHELAAMRNDVIFLVAELDYRIVAGGWFFRDGNSLFYWHGAMNRDASRYFPTCAIIDHAIQLGCKEGVDWVNFGGSANIVSLERFKSFWDAKPEKCWQFHWENPLWKSLKRFKAQLAPNG